MLASLAPRYGPSLTGRSVGLPCAPRPRLSSFGIRSGLAGGPLAGGLLRPPSASSTGPSVRWLPIAASSSGRSGGRGWSEGRSGPGKGRGRTGGRGGGGARPEDLPPDDPASAADLGALEKLVEENLAAWKAKGSTRRLSRGISTAAKLGTKSAEDGSLRERVISSLAAAYLPLVPQLRTAADCIVPLYACSRAGYWGPASAGGKGGLAVALLQRLSADGCVLLKDERRSVSDQDHANLWLALSYAPPEVRSSVVDLRGLLEASASGLLKTRGQLSTQACSNILLACARLRWRNDRLAHHLTAWVVESALPANNQQLSNTVYALGELAADVGYKPPLEDLESLVETVKARLSAESLKPLDIANLLLGCANLCAAEDTARPVVAALHRPLANECTRQRFLGFTPQQRTNSIWALSKMGFADQDWYEAAVEAALQRGFAASTKPQEWSNLWYALALARHRPCERLIKQTAEAAAGGLWQGANTQDCANLLWALAHLRLYDEQVVGALSARLVELLWQDPKQLLEQQLCNSLWALAVMGPDVLSRHSGLAEVLLHEVERRWTAEKGRMAFVAANLNQLWQVQLELPHVGGGELHRILGAGEGRSGSLLTALRDNASVAASRLVSAPIPAVEAEVASALELLREQSGPGAIVSVQRRRVVEETGRVVKVMVEPGGGRRVVIETVARSEVFANAPHDRVPFGPMALRLRQLERHFGRLCAVPYWEWEAAKAKGEQLSYLSSRLGLRQA